MGGTPVEFVGGASTEGSGAGSSSTTIRQVVPLVIPLFINTSSGRHVIPQICVDKVVL